MSNIFDLDGGVMAGLSKVADIAVLSVLYVFFCIPVFTIGAATTALYYTTVKSIRRGRGYLWKNFWSAFKSNFGQSTLMWLGLVLLGAVLAFNMYFAKSLGSGLGTVLLFVYVVLGVAIVMTAMYLFPEQSRFSLTLKDVVKNSFLMSVRHLPFTLLMIVILAICLLVGILAPISFLVLPACGAWMFSLPMEAVLKKYMPKNIENGEDEWYLE